MLVFLSHYYRQWGDEEGRGKEGKGGERDEGRGGRGCTQGRVGRRRENETKGEDGRGLDRMVEGWRGCNRGGVGKGWVEGERVGAREMKGETRWRWKGEDG